MSKRLGELFLDGERGRRVSRRAARALSRLHRGQGADALPGSGRGDSRAAGREERHPQHADRLGQVARGVGDALLVARPGPARDLHVPHQGAREREVDGALPRVRARRGGARHGRRDRQPRRADPVLHGGDPRQHGAPGGRELLDRQRRDGRVPLVRRPRPWRRLAGAAADASAHAVPADVGHAGRHEVLRGGAHRAQRPAHGQHQVERPAGAARLRVCRDPAGPHPREARRRRGRPLPTSSTSRRPTRPAAHRTSRA